MVVAAIALILALGGTAAALTHTEKRVVKKIADREIAAKAGSLSVQHAISADSASAANSASTANNANNVGFLSLSEPHNFPSIGANACASFTLGLPGAGILATDRGFVTPPDNLSIGLIAQVLPTDGGFFLQVCNATTAVIDPPLGNFKVTLIR